ncbi:MAG TPA: flagellar hook-basal body complex protein [Terriglobia bacterium]|nr:flagellar hook-basal body complex protein [Terriglobia bacterium]
MSILGAMYTAVSGLNAQSNAMGAISDNIANSQTTGYKKVDTRFQNLITVSNANTHQPGGVISSPFYANGLQGNITQTQDNTNLAISGNGFFVVSKPVSVTATGTSFNPLNYYTRAGNFEVNRDGYLVNASGYYLDGWPVDQTTGAANTALLAPIQITQLIDPPTATKEIDFVGNLPANSTVNPTPPLAPNNISIYDALGNPHTVSLVWSKRADNAWKLDIQAPGSTLDPVGGTIVGVNDQAITAPAVVTPNTPAGAQVDTVTVPAMAAGQTVTYTIGATPIVVTAPAGGYNSAQAAAAVVAAINGDPTLSSLVTAGNISSVGGTAEVDTVTIPGAGLAAGQTVSVTVNGTTVTYTAAGAETAAQVSAGLQAAIAANPTVSAVVTAADGGGTVSLTANTPGSAFVATVGGTGGATIAVTTPNVAGNGTFQVTSDKPGTSFAATVGGTAGATSATTTPNVSPVAQVDSMVLSGTVGPQEVGDTWSITVGTTQISYVNNGTETTLTDVANGLAALINANPSIGVDATVSGGTINLIARKPGTPFAAASSATNGTTAGFIDVQFGATATTAGKLAQISNAYNLSGNAQIPTSQNADDPAVITFTVDYGTGPQTVKLNLGSFQTNDGLTQYDGSATGTPTIDVQKFYQDGVAQGLLKDVNIGKDGGVQISYDNGNTKTFFKVPLAQFSDVSSLKREDGQAFVETFDSGAARLSEAGDNGSGTIRGSSLEDSNVDIAEEFSKMIVTQRAYSANTRIITTADEMLQDILAIKR